jgi:hypothetical protein
MYMIDRLNKISIDSICEMVQAVQHTLMKRQGVGGQRNKMGKDEEQKNELIWRYTWSYREEEGGFIPLHCLVKGFYSKTAKTKAKVIPMFGSTKKKKKKKKKAN